MNGYANAGVLSWLERVLFERYGHHFRLRLDGDKHHRLYLEGYPQSILIEYSPSTFGRNDSGLAFTTWDAESEDWIGVVETILPAPGAAALRAPLIGAIEDGYEIAYDILGLTYWMLSRQEEVGRSDLDEHGRFPASASHAFHHGYLLRPVVDEWLHVLGQVIARTWSGIRLTQYAYRVRLSHDVDRPSRYGFGGLRHLVRSMAGDLLKRGGRASVLRAPLIWLETRRNLHSADPYNTFDWLMDVSEANGLQSAFYFICGRTNPDRDANYDVTDPAIRKLMRRIHGRGHEIGLHPSYNTYLRPDLLASEARRLREACEREGIRQSIFGGRMHYLRWRQPETLRAWDDAGMDYDSTLGYADHVGFRCGTCHEYPAIDPVAGVGLSLRIRPLIVMDTSMFSEKYMRLSDSSKPIEVLRSLENACRQVGGVLGLLWHNSELRDEARRDIYREFAFSKNANVLI